MDLEIVAYGNDLNQCMIRLKNIRDLNISGIAASLESLRTAIQESSRLIHDVNSLAYGLNFFSIMAAVILLICSIALTLYLQFIQDSRTGKSRLKYLLIISSIFLGIALIGIVYHFGNVLGTTKEIYDNVLRLYNSSAAVQRGLDTIYANVDEVLLALRSCLRFAEKYGFNATKYNMRIIGEYERTLNTLMRELSDLKNPPYIHVSINADEVLFRYLPYIPIRVIISINYNVTKNIGDVNIFLSAICSSIRNGLTVKINGEVCKQCIASMKMHCDELNPYVDIFLNKYIIDKVINDLDRFNLTVEFVNRSASIVIRKSMWSHDVHIDPYWVVKGRNINVYMRVSYDREARFVAHCSLWRIRNVTGVGNLTIAEVHNLWYQLSEKYAIVLTNETARFVFNTSNLAPGLYYVKCYAVKIGWLFKWFYGTDRVYVRNDTLYIGRDVYYVYEYRFVKVGDLEKRGYPVDWLIKMGESRASRFGIWRLSDAHSFHLVTVLAR